MKKNHNFQLTIQKKGFSQNKSGALMGTFCSFLLFFFACGSCLLNFSLIFHPGFSILSTAELCVIPAVAGTFLFALRGREKFSYFLFGSLGILLLALYLFREDFFRQFFSAAGALEKLVRAAYNLSIFPGYTDNVKDKWILCFFLISFYMLFVLLSMLWKKRLLFVLLLGVPILCSYLLEIPVPVTLFFLPVGAFILWKGALYPITISRFWLLTLPAQGLLFLAAAYLFTPMIAPQAFQSSDALSARINAVGNKILFRNNPSQEPVQSEDGTNGSSVFSYEDQTAAQTITSTPPRYAYQTVLSVELSGISPYTLYLRGFIGSDYMDFQWTPPEDEEWYSYAQERGISRQQAQDSREKGTLSTAALPYNAKRMPFFQGKRNSVHGMEQTIEIAQKDFTGLCFVNLVDFDALWGHRRNPEGYAQELEKFDVKLGELLPLLREDDLLIITADHGNDPTHTGTDHTREKVPFIAYSPSMKENGQLPESDTFAIIGATIADNFGVDMPDGTIGYSVLDKLV